MTGAQGLRVNAPLALVGALMLCVSLAHAHTHTHLHLHMQDIKAHRPAVHAEDVALGGLLGHAAGSVAAGLCFAKLLLHALQSRAQGSKTKEKGKVRVRVHVQ